LEYRLLEAFNSAFRGKRYIHRDQTIGNIIASHLYEDLLDLGRSAKLVRGVTDRRLVVNGFNVIKGRKGRRGDGTFGDLIPGEEAKPEPGAKVLRGPVATVLIGAEMKILAKSMIKQIDRVMNDLLGQAETFKHQTGRTITVAIVGVNFSDSYTSYEGNRRYPARPAPAREAPTAIDRLTQRVTPAFDELLILRFKATNVRPFPFAWVDERETRQAYGAAILRISELFENRF
jgi:hypothetical protein